MADRTSRWAAGITVIIIALVASVGSTADKPSSSKSKQKSKTPAERPAPLIKPGDLAAHGLRDAHFEGLRSILRKTVDNKKLPGVALLLAHRGEVIFKEAFGDLKTDEAVKLASDSKPIAATVVMTVVDQKKMRLDDPLTKFVPEFKGTKVEKATVRQLLSHCAGIGDGFPGGRPRASTLAEFAAGVAAQGALQTPGRFRYSTTGIDVACRCAEKAAGRPFEELLRDNVCEPLGMKDTRFTWGGNAEAVSKEARERGEGRYVSGGGGLSGTLDDMAAFYQMHLNGGRYGDKEILSRKAVAEMHRRHAAATPAGNYGLGFYLIPPRIFQHGGVFGTFCWADPNSQLVGVFFSQGGLQKSMPIRMAVQKKVYEIILAAR